ncbi:hypothetical protein V8E36_008622 [Tilletia maclaganii]
MLATRAILALAVSAVAVSAAAIEQPAPRLVSSPKPTAAGPPGTAPVPGTICFDVFDCLFGGGGKGSVCSGGKCYTTTTSTKKSSTKKGSSSTSTVPLPSGIPAGYYPVAGRKCFDSFDCLLGDFTDTAQKCNKGQCYSNKAK